MARCGRALQISDRGLIEGSLPHGKFFPSEYAFANLWLFRNRHKYRVHDHPIRHIRGITYDGVSHALPLDTLRAEHAAAIFADGVQCIFPMDDSARDFAEKHDFTLAYEDADSDYWFAARDLATLSNSRTRRQQAVSFANKFRPVAHSLDATMIDETLAVLDGWETDTGRFTDEADGPECREALERMKELGLDGLLVRTGAGEAVAFLLASFSGNTRIIHFAKGRRAYSHAYPWMFATYAALSNAAWINFEQDLGKPGFAQAKRAYSPYKQQLKYRICPAST